MSLPVESSPDLMSGTPVFAGTRVPIQTLVDYLIAGDSIEDFLNGFPSVTRQQVITFLKEAASALTKSVAISSSAAQTYSPPDQAQGQ